MERMERIWKMPFMRTREERTSKPVNLFFTKWWHQREKCHRLYRVETVEIKAKYKNETF